MDLARKLESLLFASPRPLSYRKLAELAGARPEEVKPVVKELAAKLNIDTSGINILRHGESVQMVTSPLESKLITQFLKEEQAGELTRPSLETLTIIAYRGPISKIQLDTIRGVNCALILRNLMIKGLVEAKAHKDKLQSSYQVTTDFIRFLGLNRIAELPDYETLNQNEHLDTLLNPPDVDRVTEQGANEEKATSLEKIPNPK